MGEEKFTKTFVISVLICVFGGSFQYGWNISNVNGPAQFIKNTLYPSECYVNCEAEGNSTYLPSLTVDEDFCNCTKEEYDEQIEIQTAQFSTAVSMFPIGGMIGSFSTTFMVTKFGRKGAQMLNMGLSILGALLYILSYYLAR